MSRLTRDGTAEPYTHLDTTVIPSEGTRERLTKCTRTYFPGLHVHISADLDIELGEIGPIPLPLLINIFSEQRLKSADFAFLDFRPTQSLSDQMEIKKEQTNGIRTLRVLFVVSSKCRQITGIS